ncbi:hypothetical protein CGZ93_02415 [Enemella dayhoffiae]|uniref:LGFP repeat-containing protein n=1 Tax=Enemella dayhoffiae TaxID=2016507 RepID=A0A255HCP8_9ACTN|nr:hypothetical protein [Enemella dayhoffiae]OYO25312.1 hypothetical protein CGZ93_02415 [Enemella dayhoffiae]
MLLLITLLIGLVQGVAPRAYAAPTPATPRVSWPAGGHVYWNPSTGAHPVWGEIYRRWAELRYENGRMGYPVSDENCGLVGGGCFQLFQGGLVYWSPASGAYPVWGLIRDSWAASGWERGRWGYPTGPEICEPRHCWQSFQGGVLDVRW